MLLLYIRKNFFGWWVTDLLPQFAKSKLCKYETQLIKLLPNKNILWTK